MSRSNLAVAEKFYTSEEYLDFEREALDKHEFVDGEIIAMAGASREHNLIGTNVGTEIRFNLKGRNCETYISDMRVRTKPNRYRYPDVVLICGEPQFDDDEEFDILLNPTVVIEVLSKSTEFRDKTEKLEEYRKMDSIRECLLISQDEMHIQHFIKQTVKQWILRIYETPDEIVVLESIGCEILLADIYAQVQFDEEESE